MRGPLGNPDRWIRSAGVLLILGGIGGCFAVFGIILFISALAADVPGDVAVWIFPGIAASIVGGVFAGIGVLRRSHWARVAGLLFAGVITALLIVGIVSSLLQGAVEDVQGAFEVAWSVTLATPGVVVIYALVRTWSVYDRSETPMPPIADDGSSVSLSGR